MWLSKVLISVAVVLIGGGAAEGGGSGAERTTPRGRGGPSPGRRVDQEGEGAEGGQSPSSTSLSLNYVRHPPITCFRSNVFFILLDS